MPQTPNTGNKVTPTALVTGAGTGIGRGISERLLKEGWNVIAVGRRLDPLKELESHHPPKRVLPLSCDLTSEIDVRRVKERLESDKHFGATLAALVNNAGIFTRTPFLETTDEQWRSMVETNLLGPVRLTRALYPLLKANHGVIVNVASTLGLRPVADTSAYSAAKAGMVSWTEALAIEAARDGIRVNCVAPGIVDTPIHGFHEDTAIEKKKLGHLQPLGRIGHPDDVAHAVWSLIGPGSEWMTGSILKVDGGIHLV